MEKEINPVDFYKFFDGKIDYASIMDEGGDDWVINLPIRFDERNYLSSYATISNCIFNDELSFENLNFKSGIHFNNCIFKSYLKFSNVKSLVPIEELVNKDESICFDNCEFHAQTNFKNLKLFRGITFKGCKEISNIQIENFESERGVFSILDSICIGSIDLSNILLMNSIDLRKTIIHGLVRFKNIRSIGISLHKNTFAKDVYFKVGKINGDISSSENSYSDDFIIEAVEFKGLSFINDNFKRHIEINFSDLFNKLKQWHSKIFVKSSNIEDGLIVNNKNSDQKFVISEIVIKSTALLKGLFEFNNLSIEKIELSGHNSNADLVFNEIDCQRLIINRFTNSSNLQFNNFTSTISKNSEIIISYSNLGKAHFHGFNFNSFEAIEIVESSIFEISTSVVEWFELAILNNNIEPKDKRYYKNLREIFRQYKLAMENQGDRIQALDFKEYELINFKQELKHIAKSNKIADIIKTKHINYLKRGLLIIQKKRIGDRLLMIFNLSNNYGQNWLKPALLAIFFNIPLFIIMTISVKLSWGHDFSSAGVSNTYFILCENSSAYWRMFNPTHLQDKLFDGVVSWNGLASFFDIFQRIVISYFIFQTVSAFRKYIR